MSPAEALWVIEYDDTSWTQQMRAWGALVGIPLEELPTNWHRRTLRHLEDTGQVILPRRHNGQEADTP